MLFVTKIIMLFAKLVYAPNIQKAFCHVKSNIVQWLIDKNILANDAYSKNITQRWHVNLYLFCLDAKIVDSIFVRILSWINVVVIHF